MKKVLIIAALFASQAWADDFFNNPTQQAFDRQIQMQQAQQMQVQQLQQNSAPVERGTYLENRVPSVGSFGGSTNGYRKFY